MRFGLQIEPQFGHAYDDVREIAVLAERSGIEALWCSDHLFLDANAVATNCLEVWTLLAAIARETTTLRLGTLVTCQSYRNPALLAKIAAGVDHLSGGRLEFGLGAGWKEVEYRAYGYDFPPPATRVDELVDTIEICRRMWSEERATYRGKRYHVEEAPCAPKPVQRPLRILVAGARPRLMRVVARHADAVNVGGFPTLDAYRESIVALDRACADIGRDPASILRSHFTMTVLGETRADVERVVDELAARARRSRGEWLAARPHFIVGTPDEVCERLRAFAKLGVSYFIPVFPYRHEREMLTLLAERVAPALRAA